MSSCLNRAFCPVPSLVLVADSFRCQPRAAAQIGHDEAHAADRERLRDRATRRLPTNNAERVRDRRNRAVSRPAAVVSELLPEKSWSSTCTRPACCERTDHWAKCERCRSWHGNRLPRCCWCRCNGGPRVDEEQRPLLHDRRIRALIGRAKIAAGRKRDAERGAAEREGVETAARYRLRPNRARHFDSVKIIGGGHQTLDRQLGGVSRRGRGRKHRGKGRRGQGFVETHAEANPDARVLEAN